MDSWACLAVRWRTLSRRQRKEPECGRNLRVKYQQETVAGSEAPPQDDLRGSSGIQRRTLGVGGREHPVGSAIAFVLRRQHVAGCSRLGESAQHI